MRRFLILACIALAVTVSSMAQPDPDHPQPEARVPANQRPAQAQQPQAQLFQRAMMLSNQQRTQMCLTPQGVFVLRSGVLAKLHPTTLEIQHDPVELFGPLPVRPAEENPAANLQLLNESIKRMLPAAMLAQGDDVLIVVGEQYFRVDAATLDVKVNTPLGNPFQPNQYEMMRLREASDPTLSVRDKTLYVAMVDKVVAVNIADGVVLARGQMPAKMQMPPMQQLMPLLRNMNMPRDQQPAVEAKPITLIGTLTHHDDHGGFWAVKIPENNEEYVLSGDRLTELSHILNVAGRRIRVTGMLTPPTTVQLNGKGVLEITQYQLLGSE